MELIKPSTKIMTPINGEEILISIEAVARDCYQSEGKIEIEENAYTDGVHQVIIGYSRTAISARKLIPMLIEKQHDAMLEFGGMVVVKFICDRGVSHELVRHRMASFAQESTRFCNYTKGEHIQFIIPSWFSEEDKELAKGKHTSIGRGSDWQPFTADSPEEVWFTSVADAEVSYNFLIKEKGWTAQEARSVLPNSLKTTINVGANIREWRHIFKLRTAKAAHPQMREIMRPLLDEFKKLIPILFDDIIY